MSCHVASAVNRRRQASTAVIGSLDGGRFGLGALVGDCCVSDTLIGGCCVFHMLIGGRRVPSALIGRRCVSAALIGRCTCHVAPLRVYSCYLLQFRLWRRSTLADPRHTQSRLPRAQPVHNAPFHIFRRLLYSIISHRMLSCS